MKKTRFVPEGLAIFTVGKTRRGATAKNITKNVDPSRLSQIGNPEDDDWIVGINLSLEIAPLSSRLPKVDAPLLLSLAS